MDNPVSPPTDGRNRSDETKPEIRRKRWLRWIAKKCVKRTTLLVVLRVLWWLHRIIGWFDSDTD